MRVKLKLEPGEHTGVTLDGKDILVVRIGETYHALDNKCSHGKARLSEGRLRGTNIICPRHGGSFDVTTGKCTGRPALLDQNTYPVKDEGDGVISLETA